jgi:hypothetical protein
VTGVQTCALPILSYNSLHYDLKKKVGDPRSKYRRNTYFAANMDDDDKTEDNTGILDKNNELVELDGVSVKNDLQSFERFTYALCSNSHFFLLSNSGFLFLLFL